MISMRQQKRSASRGAVRTHMFSGGSAPSTAPQARERFVQQARAERPVVGEARRAGGAATIMSGRAARRERAERHRLVVDGDDALAPAHLLLHQVAEQVAALRAVA